MLNKVRLWVRRHMKVTIREWSIGLIIGGSIVFVSEIIIRNSLPALWIGLSGLILGILGRFVSQYWNKIAIKMPFEKIKKEAFPNSYINAEIKEVNKIPDENYLSLDINFSSRLYYDVGLRVLSGSATIFFNNDSETASLNNQSLIVIKKNDDTLVQKLSVNLTQRVMYSLEGNLRMERTIKLKVDLIAFDEKGREYKWSNLAKVVK